MSFEVAYQVNLILEGGLVETDRPDDAGGLTYAGITYRNWVRWWDQRGVEPPAWNKHQKPSEGAVKTYYHDAYWLPSGAWRLREPIDALFFQIWTNMPGHAVRCLQAAVNAWPADGELGTQTVLAAQGIPLDRQAAALLAAQRMWYVQTHDAGDPNLHGLFMRPAHALAALKQVAPEMALLIGT